MIKRKASLKVKVQLEQASRSKLMLERKNTKISRINKFEQLRRDNEAARVMHESQETTRNVVTRDSTRGR